ncbi:VWA domain-containing protein [Actinoallomurus purpureus]|uniref:VWA domain-containing protein n=1 Tax=Actinoallomurus purpureus TaxID=478114 RepID=UPI002092C8F6|nr:VWA domain-containing protein [Actinoallomurus purpureus]MCO6006223.1 VWA domain-containing protein [Actinoallomurus purpureus]
MTSTQTIPKGANAPIAAASFDVVMTWNRGPDANICVLLLGADGKVRSDEDFVFYNQPRHPSEAASYTGKSTVGTIRDTFRIDLAQVPADVERLVVGASVDGGTFGQLVGLGLTMTGAGSGGADLVFEVPDATTEAALLLGELYRRDGAWKVRAVGQGYDSGLAGFATEFGVDVGAPEAPADAQPPVSKRDKLIKMEKEVAKVSPALLSMTKTAAFSLHKRGLSEHTARVGLVVDVSFSMKSDFSKYQLLVERVLALALRFDDNGEIDVWLFDGRTIHAEPVTLANYATYIKDVAKRYQNKIWGGTQYAQAMCKVREHYFGSSQVRRTPLGAPVPVYVMFVTDGGTWGDIPETVEQVRSSSYEPLFWQFMAIGSKVDSARPQKFKKGWRRPAGRREFELLEGLDDLNNRHVDNADFFAVKDPGTLKDEELYELLMTEYPGWFTQAPAKGLLPVGA